MGGPERMEGRVPFLRHGGPARFDASQARPWLVNDLIDLCGSGASAHDHDHVHHRSAKAAVAPGHRLRHRARTRWLA